MNSGLPAARTVAAWLDSTGQDDACCEIAAALGIDPTEMLNEAPEVPDQVTWAAAVLAMIRSVDPVTAALLGAIAVAPPWAPADMAQLGRIAAGVRAAEQLPGDCETAR